MNHHYIRENIINNRNIPRFSAAVILQRWNDTSDIFNGKCFNGIHMKAAYSGTPSPYMKLLTVIEMST